MSHLTHCPKVVDASDAASCVQSSCRNVDWLPRELPDGDDRAENQDRTNCHLDDVAALFFRANQKRVSGFVVLIFQLICCACLFFHDATFRRRANGRDDNDHQISATYGIRKVRHFRARLGPRVLSCQSSPHNEVIRAGAMGEYRASGNRATARIRFCDRGRRAVSTLAKQQTEEVNL
jgi:hypothetical protein